MKRKRKPRGGKSKLGRSIVVTVRFDSRLHFLVDLASRKQRRTISSFMEWAAEEALNQVRLGDGLDKDHTIGGWATRLWNPDPVSRYLTIAFEFPELLTYEEQELRNMIWNNGYLWIGDYESGEYRWSHKRDKLLEGRLRDNWDKFKAVADGNAHRSTLPKWEKTKKKER